MKKTHLSHSSVRQLVDALRREIAAAFPGRSVIHVYPIPRGGVPVAYHLPATHFRVVDAPEQADVFVDDLVDSGRTRSLWKERFPITPFHALLDKQRAPQLGWVVFPWESEQEGDDSIVGTLRNRLREDGAPFLANNNVSQVFRSEKEKDDLQEEVGRRSQALLEALLIDTTNDHNTQETSRRMAKMYVREICRGRFEPPPSLTTFPNINHLDELVATGPITVRSLCSHHFCPIVGKCWIGVVPGERLIGLSKFNRIVEWYSARPQIQEELAVQIADYLEQQLRPEGVAVVVRASHTCMTWRGVREGGDAVMTTNVMRGVFRTKPEARAEFLGLVRE